MGSTMFEGGSLQKVLQFNQIKLPKPHKIIQLLTSLYNDLQVI
jgi:hypothetical protein